MMIKNLNDFKQGKTQKKKSYWLYWFVLALLNKQLIHELVFLNILTEGLRFNLDLLLDYKEILIKKKII